MRRLTFITCAALLTGTIWMTTASALPTDKSQNPQRFAAARVRIAHRVDRRHDEWLQDKHDRRAKIRERREARAAAEAAVEPTSAPTPSYSPSYSTSSTSWQLSESELASLLSAAGFPADVVPTMIYIARRESNLCPTAVYGYGCAGGDHFYAGGPACGIFQLFECPGPAAMDPATNVAMAYSKYKAAGYSLSPWAMTAP